MTPTGRLTDRVCLVTGSTGIAAASARRFAAEGAAVFIVSRNPDHAAALAAEVASAGSEQQPGWLAADLAIAPEADRAVALAVERFGRIDGAFVIAGGSGRRLGDGPIHELSPDGWDMTLELNLRTQALTCAAVVR